jgi:hypothetical protein
MVHGKKEKGRLKTLVWIEFLASRVLIMKEP